MQVKASFLAFYWKLFDGLPKYKKWWLMVAIFAFASYAGCWIASALTCHPASLYFEFGTYLFPLATEEVTDVINQDNATSLLISKARPSP